MTYFTYTKAAWHEMVQRPEDREAAARRVVEANGGRLLASHWMFGDRDGLAIHEAPHAVAAAAALATIRATGRVEEMPTRVLLTGPEAQQVLGMAKFAASECALPGGATPWHTDDESHG